MLEQILWQEHNERVLCRLDHVGLGLVEPLVVQIASDRNRKRVVEHSHPVPLEIGMGERERGSLVSKETGTG